MKKPTMLAVTFVAIMGLAVNAAMAEDAKYYKTHDGKMRAVQQVYKDKTGKEVHKDYKQEYIDFKDGRRLSNDKSSSYKKDLDAYKK